MKKFVKDEFVQFIIKNEIVGIWPQEILLKSGKKSLYYVDWRKATNDAFLLDQLTNYLLQFISGQELVCDTLFGVPEGATKTAVIAGMKLAKAAENWGPGSHVVSMGRAKAKEHGNPADRYYVGAPRGKTWVLEDTVTTGQSLLATLEKLTVDYIDLGGVFVLTDRMDTNAQGETVKAQILKKYPSLYYLPLLTIKDVMPQVLEVQNIPGSVRMRLEAEINKL